MPTQNKDTSWERIQSGVKEAEKLITQRDYNSALIKCRQTLEFMVKQLAARAHIQEDGDLKSMIDELYQNRWISKTTCEHYHTIRMAGNKAVHEGYNNAYDATQAHHMLSQEVYSFSNDYSNALKGVRSRKSSSSGNTSRSRKRTSGKQQKNIGAATILKLLIPVLCVILLILIIRMIKPAPDTADSTLAPAPTETYEETQAAEPAPQETATVYKTTTVLNVRSEPSTDSTVLGKLSSGAVVEYIESADADWAKILYNGQEAYVASQYLTTE
ncbi:MAG: SH3 domain-containing protein [Clostridiales bacterium]|nr:SH3 domain-containing protein [Clostridiales bacterium]